MSLQYRLFKSPGNVSEIVDRAQRTGELPEVYATRQNIGTLVPTAQRFEYAVNVCMGRTRVSVCRWEKAFEFFCEQLNSDRYDFVAANEYARCEVFF